MSRVCKCRLLDSSAGHGAEAPPFAGKTETHHCKGSPVGREESQAAVAQHAPSSAHAVTTF
eukprot:4750457-Alexandrium_andersonii.AAC.1